MVKHNYLSTEDTKIYYGLYYTCSMVLKFKGEFWARGVDLGAVLHTHTQTNVKLLTE